MEQRRVVLLVLFLVGCLHKAVPANSLRSECPRIFPNVFKRYTPRGNLSAGFYEKINDIDTLIPCVLSCCHKPTCNVAFMTGDTCFHIACKSNEFCIPTPNSHSSKADDVLMVLVNPTDDETWEEVLAAEEFSASDLDRELFNVLIQRRYQNGVKALANELIFEGDAYAVSCELSAENACQLPNEICVKKEEHNDVSKDIGVCTCKDGFSREIDGVCSPVSNNYAYMADHKEQELPKESPAVTKQHLTVLAESKQVKLPENEVTLVAKTVPEEDRENKYQYEWTSLLQPEGSTAVKHQNDNELHLEKLSEGTYAFRVSASTASAYGDTFVNVSVLPEARINTPPNIIITPANQTIKQPNTAAVLDASSSTDDDGIISWHWELQQGPLGYQPELKDSSTLQLNDLTKPGNYSFKLTVTDTDKATSSSIANITVLAVTDYPPEANAGEHKVIYLPHNNITLNGSLSTDDHAITTWEWTKSADDAQKTVDMQNTRTPYLQLSNLQEGVYTFTLKVMDSANQSSTAQVHVFVKPPTNKPPFADAGANTTISLPQTWAVVDGSNSTDDNHITLFKWEQIEGPSTVIFENASLSKTNVTGLTKGVYTLKLSVTDDNNNVANDLTYIIVNQNKNQKPTANAGPDLVLELPVNGIVLNGSNSKDDWEIVKWQWTRDEKSLAIGNIVEHSDESPVLILTDVSVGTYIFNLTVYDKQGLSDTATVSVVVKNDPKLFYLVDLYIDVDAKLLTEAQYNTLKAKLALLLIEGSKLQVRKVKPEAGTGNVMLTFYLEAGDGSPIAANTVVQHLSTKFRVDASLLGFSVSTLQTSICQNNCSGHGDLTKIFLEMGEDSDCSWSVLYVVLGLFCIMLTFSACIWFGVYFICFRWCPSRYDTSQPTNYKLIEDREDLPPFSGRKGNISDSDTDSDVVFESRTKPPRFSDTRNGHKASRNGFSKPGRRIKT
ncbi:hypothetical protein D910_07061 [Dendroctonus ponderosae]